MLTSGGVRALTKTKEAEGQHGNDVQVESLVNALC